MALIFALIMSAAIVSSQDVEMTYWEENQDLAGYEFIQNIIFVYNTNKLRCAGKCSFDSQCRSWTYSGSNCIGYNSIFTGLGNSVVSVTARYYVTHDSGEDCSTLSSADSPSGVYILSPPNIQNGLPVYCDMDTAGGGWTVIQNRYDGSVDFYLNWTDYKYGFGNLNEEFWLGNEYVYLLMQNADYMLRIELLDQNGDNAYAHYTTFKINDEMDGYRLTIGGYSGTAGDDKKGMSYNDGQRFSTKDNDLTNSCTSRCIGAWWYTECSYVNLNGPWLPGTNGWQTMMFDSFRGQVGLKKTSMKLKRK